MSGTRVIRVDPFYPEEERLREAAEYIVKGRLVAFPTETVYGLGADATNPGAVARIFRVKGRPADNPVIVHVSSVNSLEEVSEGLPEEAYRLVSRLWPGPLTIVVPRSGRVPPIVTAGLAKVAVRMPAHPVALKLIEYAGRPVAAPSANLSGKPSPTRGEDVVRDLMGKVDVIVDSGETMFGVESTIIDLTVKPPRLLRPGPYPVEALESILGARVEVPGFARGLGEAERAVAPGTKYRHYAPDTPLVLVEAEDYSDLGGLVSAVKEVVGRLASRGARVAVLCSEETCGEYSGVEGVVRVIRVGSRSRPLSVAKGLFPSLRELDRVRPDYGVAEGYEELGVGLAIMNRLRKASSFIVRAGSVESGEALLRP